MLWVRASGFALAAVAAAALAHPAGALVPDSLVRLVGEDPVQELLKVMASSMLAVASFSLTTVVAAYASVTANASPRAAGLLMEDTSAQNALSSFIAAFIFSIVGLVALGTGLYEGGPRFVLFVETLVVLAIVVVRLLRWIDQASHLGRVGSAIDQIEAALIQALAKREPFLGGVPDGEPPEGSVPVSSDTVGYVQHIDVRRLEKVARRGSFTVHVVVLPGSFARRSRPLLYLEGVQEVDEELRAELLEGVVIGDSRTFQQDPRFGLVVLSEVASRALSPAINDPGTAIDVVGTGARILSTWAAHHWEEKPRVKFERVAVAGLSAADCFEDIFSPIARNGAAFLEVGMALQKTFADLARIEAPGFRDAALAHSKQALARAERALDLEEDKARLRACAATVAEAAQAEGPQSRRRGKRNPPRAD